jgi:NADH:ubiquinone oxidoreductase subunit 6 (subunit J)
MVPLLLAADSPKLIDLWPLFLPLLVGAAAVYLLLPRPRPFPTIYGVLLTAVALILSGVLILRAGALSSERLLFWAFSVVAVVSGGLLATQHNPARAALSFALVVLSSCGLFLLLGAPFLMAATIIIYAGAIIVTFLFVLMLAQQTGLTDADIRSREPMLAVVTGFVLLAALLFVIRSNYFDNTDLDSLIGELRQTPPEDGDARYDRYDGLITRLRTAVKDLGMIDLSDRLQNESDFQVSKPASVEAFEKARKGMEDLAREARSRVGLPSPKAAGLDLSDLSGPSLLQQRKNAEGNPSRELRRDADGRPALPAENAAYLGRSLFTDYLVAVELGGLLLLVAVVGAIVIAYRHHKPVSPEGQP